MNFVGMAIAAYEIPHINPVKFVQVAGELVRDPRHNSIHIDQDWFQNYIREWQTKTCYPQLWQFNDKIAFYVNALDTKEVTWQLLDMSGTEMLNTTQTSYTTAPGNVIKIGNNSYAARTYVKRFRASDWGSIPEGLYVWLCSIKYDFDNDGTVDETIQLISEPQSFATLHPDTVLLEYYNTYNAQDILFQQTGIKFTKRLRADVVDYGVGSNDTDYTDGAENPQTLASTPYRTAKFTTTDRVPEYELDKINRAWSCDRMSVDGKAFVKEPGAKFEVSKISRFPKVQAAINIREADARASARGILVTNVPIYTTPAYPFAVFYVALFAVDGVVYEFPNVPVVIRDGIEHLAFISALNTYAHNSLFLDGSFSEIAGVLTWVNGVSDTIVASSVWFYDTPLTLQTSASLLYPIGIYNGDIVIDYGTGFERVTGTSFANSNPQALPGGAVTINIFGQTQLLLIQDPDISAIGGLIPAGTGFFQANNCNSITNFDAGILSAADSTLQSLLVYGNAALSTITGWGAGVLLPAIQKISFAANNLNSTECSALVNVIDSNVATNGYPLNAELSVNAQTTAAPMIGAGILAKPDLIFNYGWQVYTD